MRIALTADPELPVPPKHYGGIERIIDLLARELVRRGHEVTLFAHPASASAGRLIPYPGKSSASALDTVRNAATIARQVIGGGTDVVHSFSRLAYLLPILPMRIPKLMTYQRAITPRSIRLGSLMSRGSLQFAAISNHMMKPVAGIGTWHVVPNCASLESYEFQPKVGSDAPLMFLGRIEEIKGTHVAIEVARRSGLQLCIAGNVPAGEERYFESRIRPFIDGEAVVYVGPVDDARKEPSVGQGAGAVDAGALGGAVRYRHGRGHGLRHAGGRASIAARCRRSCEDGVSGFVRADIDGLVEGVARLGEIDRRHCRDRVERQFSETVLADRYLSAYRDVITACGRRADR